MGFDLLIEDAKRRREAFENLEKYLSTIKEVAKSLDPNAEVYLFGSVAEGRHVLSSDIDVLVVTTADPPVVLERLWRAGIGPPFEVHVRPPEALPLYQKRSRLVRV